jgi:hypothetical protein
MNNDRIQINSINKSLDLISNELQYLDLREFIALNKIVLEGSQHKEIINQVKAKFLNLALKRMSNQKERETKVFFKTLKEENLQGGREGKAKMLDTQIDYLLNQGDELKELYYKCYYKIKQIKTQKDNKDKLEYKKYQSLEKITSDRKNSIIIPLKLSE